MTGGQYDAFSKEVFREGGRDMVAWLTGLDPLTVEPQPTEIIVAEARQADLLFRVVLGRDPPRERFLHLEVQTAGDADMPRRMRDYWVRAEGSLARRERAGRTPVLLSSFVVYLDRKSA